MQENPNPTKKPPNKIAIWAAVSTLVIMMVVGISVLTSWCFLQISNSNLQQAAANDGNLRLTEEETDLARVVEKISPSVVSIIATYDNKSPFSAAKQSAGTGMIISVNGYILTNKHVVEGANGVIIVTNDGSIYKEVEFVGKDPLNDVAFLRIKNVNDLPAVELGDSGTVKVGQKVVAIGNSLGQYQNTVTSGIVSGKGRPVMAGSEDEDEDEAESLTDLIQTDAAINLGNSGGPLINLSGQVVGINTAIVSDAQSIGFAIPINAVKGLTRGVLADGQIKKAYLGVNYMDITPEVRAQYKLSVKSGAYVGGSSGEVVDRVSPAEKAGIKKGDIITKINDKTVGQDGGLATLLAEFLPGEQVNITVIRNDKEISLSLMLGAYKSQD